MKSTPLYIFGKHAALAALANPMRKIKQVRVTAVARKEIGEKPFAGLKNISVDDAKKIESLLPPGSVHQGIAVESEPLEQPSLDEWLENKENKPILLLDQVTDPHNVGAILRSAAAFDVGAVITTDRNAAQESGTLAKSASGALEIVPMIQVVNLVQAIDMLKKHEYWSVGLDGAAKQSLSELKQLDKKTALVLGAEGQGLRRLTAEHCDFLAKLPISPRMESLNVSNAAAVALYELYRRL